MLASLVFLGGHSDAVTAGVLIWARQGGHEHFFPQHVNTLDGCGYGPEHWPSDMGRSYEPAIGSSIFRRMNLIQTRTTPIRSGEKRIGAQENNLTETS